MTALASIMSMTVVVSSAHSARSVRGVGWCSMVRLAPRIHSALRGRGDLHRAPASTPTASPRPTPAAARPPAMRRARSCTSPQVCRTGLVRLTGDHALAAGRALRNIFSVNLLTTDLLGSGAVCPRAEESHVPPAADALHSRRAHTIGERFGLDSVMSRATAVRPDHARPGPGWAMHVACRPLVITADHLKLPLSNCQIRGFCERVTACDLKRS